MKFFKLAIAVVFALWTLGVMVGVVSQIGSHGGTRGTAELVGGIAAGLIMIAVTAWLFQWALRKPK